MTVVFQPGDLVKHVGVDGGIMRVYGVFDPDDVIYLGRPDIMLLVSTVTHNTRHRVYENDVLVLHPKLGLVWAEITELKRV